MRTFILAAALSMAFSCVAAHAQTASAPAPNSSARQPTKAAPAWLDRRLPHLDLEPDSTLLAPNSAVNLSEAS